MQPARGNDTILAFTIDATVLLRSWPIPPSPQGPNEIDPPGLAKDPDGKLLCLTDFKVGWPSQSNANSRVLTPIVGSPFPAEL